MKIEIQIDGGKYPIGIQFLLDKNGKVIYSSEYLGSTISTFPNHLSFSGNTIDESIALISNALRKALQELLLI